MGPAPSRLGPEGELIARCLGAFPLHSLDPGPAGARRPAPQVGPLGTFPHDGMQFAVGPVINPRPQGEIGTVEALVMSLEGDHALMPRHRRAKFEILPYL